MHAPRSLKHEYELFVEREIEDYKDSIPRSAILAIGDEAVAALREQAQTTFTELVIWEEVDRIIARRIRLPSYSTWRRRRLKTLAELRKPERWGLHPNSPLAREVRASEGEHVLVAGMDDEGAAIFSAALGCAVTAIDAAPDAVERVMVAAEQAGLMTRVRPLVGDIAGWAPDVALRLVVCSPQAFEGLAPEERERAIATLQSATLDGGVHLVQTIVAGTAGPTLEELRARYAGWAISVESESATGPTFLARKQAELH
ncbi:SAM-dependent methyltransferase [Roseisolibacter agri]|uniref:Uncharacterized protein n=1 Tax=Roseisolibacter agri TaxID=2014610 RepID=A0AA37Q8Z7_9BACT|nr:class I SAM-dependent methyltransferase [Roseisolibacter agri]GLC28494.1 hypothetical protein rosag_50070 [Roseisolibacter agri]